MPSPERPTIMDVFINKNIGLSSKFIQNLRQNDTNITEM